MTFEKALEAMRQGKKVRRKIYSAYEYWFYNSDFDRVIVYDGENYRDFGVKATHDIIESCKDDWEIYEEPQKEPEMTTEKAIAFLQTACGSIKIAKKNNVAHILYDGFDEAIDCINFAIEALENQNQPELTGKDIQKLAFDNFVAGLKYGLELARDLEKERKYNA